MQHVRDDFIAVEIRDLLQQLEPDHRTALELRYLLGFSGEEAAALMGRTHGAFRSLLLRAARAFRDLSDKSGLPVEPPAPVRSGDAELTRPAGGG